MTTIGEWNFNHDINGWYAHKGVGWSTDNFIWNDGTSSVWNDREGAYRKREYVLGQTEQEAVNFVKKFLGENKVSEMNYIRSDSGRYSGVYEGKAFVVGSDHVNYDKIKECFQTQDYSNFWELANPAKAVENFMVGKVTVEGGQVFCGGQEVKNAVVDKIFQFMDEKLPVEPLTRFLENLMQNPSMASRNELYDFLDAGQFPLTPDGYFLAYKGLRNDYYDIHSGKFLNTPGSVIEMERRDVDDDRRRQCSYGFHVGAYQYANNFQEGKLVMVKVNPKDVVSVPEDYNCQKCRVCKYEVVQDCEIQLNCALVSKNEEGEYEEYEDAEEADVCFECGADVDYCECENF